MLLAADTQNPLGRCVPACKGIRCFLDDANESGLPLSVRTRLAGYIFGVGKTLEEKRMLKRMFNLAGFQRSGNHQLKFMLDIEDFRQRSQVLLDSRLSDAQKTERLADLGERYLRLSRALHAPADPALK